MSAPAISVLLPAFNAAPVLCASVQSVLDQTFGDFELLIVNDGSTDETAAILREIRDPRVRVLTNPTNRGLTRSLNRALAEARGEFIARQDADDLSEPHRFEKQIAFLRARPHVALLGTAGWRVNSSARTTGSNDLPTTHDAILWTSVTDNPFLHTSIMFRRAVIAGEFGGYDEEYLICQDFALWSRIAARRQVANLVQRLVRMREHPASLTQTRAEQTTSEVNRILESNWNRIFPGREFTAEERDLLVSFRLQVPAERISALRLLLNALRKEFETSHPNTRRSAAFHATLSRQSLRLAYKTFAIAPRRAMQEVGRAFRESPREWSRQLFLWLRFLPRRMVS